MKNRFQSKQCTTLPRRLEHANDQPGRAALLNEALLDGKITIDECRQFMARLQDAYPATRDVLAAILEAEQAHAADLTDLLPATSLYAGYDDCIYQPPTEGMTAMLKRTQYIKKMKLQLDELNAKLGEFDAKAKEIKGQALDTYHADVTALRQQSKAARAKFDEIVAAGEDSWEKMIAEMDKIGAAFSHSVSYFKSQIK